MPAIPLAAAGLALLCLATPLRAQGPDLGTPVHATSLTLGLGGNSIGLGAMAELTHRRGMFDLSGRGLGALRLDFFGGGARSIGDLGVLYGIHPLRNPNLLAVRAGVGVVGYSTAPFGFSTERSSTTRIGFPWEMAMTGTLADILAGGLSVVGNFNGARNYIGVMLVLQFGRMHRSAP